MNLMDLFIKIGVDDQASGKIPEISNRFSSLGSTIGKGLAAAAKVGVAAMSAAISGIAALTTTAMKNYAEFEQLSGGAALMFGGAYDTVAQNAQEAFRTVQMSQNDYLQQVNGFATGLKTALGGNEQAAAELAHRIIQAEADIVAATGNTSENVQNAFNGIMKNNFTMLDNLQIGITPTKEGFQEVIDKVNEWNAAQGNATNYQMGNLADMQSALVDYVDMVGMSGYAQEEAAGTIQGSLAMTKAAWSNLTTAMAGGGDVGQAVDGFTESITAAAQNILPRITETIPNVVSGIQSVVGTLAQTLPPMLNAAIESVVASAPAIFEGILSIAQTVLEAITSNAEGITSAFLEIVMSLANTILDPGFLTSIMDAAVTIVVTLANGLAAAAPQLLEAASTAIITLCEGLLNNLDPLLDAAIALVLALMDGLVSAVPMLAGYVPEIISTIYVALIENLPQILSAGVELIVEFYNGMVSSYGKLTTGGIEAILKVVQAIKSNFGKLTAAGGDAINALWNGMKGVFANLLSWVQGAWNQVVGIFSGTALGNLMFGKSAGGQNLTGFGDLNDWINGWDLDGLTSPPPVENKSNFMPGSANPQASGMPSTIFNNTFNFNGTNATPYEMAQEFNRAQSRSQMAW